MPSREDYERAMGVISKGGVAGIKAYHEKTGTWPELIIEAYVAQLERPLSDGVAEAVERTRARIEALRFAGECPGYEVEPGGYSGCTATITGELDCPTCGQAADDDLDTITRALRGEE